MGAPIRFQPGDCWEFDGTRLRFDKQLGDQLLLFIVERTLAPFQVEDGGDGLRAPDFDWASRAFAAGRLRQVADRRGLPSARQQAEKREYDPEAAAKMDAQYRMRRFVLQGFDTIGHVDLGEKSIARALTRLWREQPEKALALGPMPSTRSVKRWMETS